MLHKKWFKFNESDFNCLLRLILLFLIYLNYFYPMTSSGQEIWKGLKTIPAITPTGIDFKIFYNYAIDLWHFNRLDLTSIYPPFSTLMVSPYIIFSPINAYRLHAVFIYFSFYASLILAGKIFYFTEKSDQFLKPELLFFLVGIMGYPFLFALERGNSDILACLFSLLFLLKVKKQKYFLAIIFLILATQLKIYPLFLSFILLKGHVRKYFYLFVVGNFILLFSLGIVGFDTLISNLMYWSDKPYIWIGNHSAHSFSTFLSSWLSNYAQVVIDYKILKNIILFPFLGVWFWSLWTYLSNDYNKINFFRFCLNSFLLSCVFTAVSHDYKLLILYPLIYVIIRWIPVEKKTLNAANIIMSLVACSYVFLLHLPYAYIRWELFTNKLPTLFYILITANLILSYVKKVDLETKAMDAL